ncbi:MAG TPA: hypothetical protein VGM51_04450 [Armatimonadota bacterium]|jgi:hypothetical protein
MQMRSTVTIFLCGVLGAVVLAATANTINSQVSPEYFRVVMGWESVTNLSRTIVAQGILEALVAGTLLSLTLTCGIVLTMRSEASIRAGLSCLARILVGAAAGWLAGGAIGVLLCSLGPDLFANAFYGAGKPLSISRFAWVGGSIWGIYLGAVVSIVLVLVALKSSQESVPRKR